MTDIYSKEEIPDKFMDYVKKYAMTAEEFQGVKARFPEADQPYDLITELAHNYPEQRCVSFSYEWMERCDPILAATLEATPESFLAAASLAVRAIDVPVDLPEPMKDIRVQVSNHPYQTHIRAIRAKHSNRFVSVEGIVRSVGKKETTYTEIAWKCKRCETVTYEKQDDEGKEVSPVQCSNEGCSNMKFWTMVPELSTQLDYQLVEVEEPLAGLNGRTPEAIRVALYENLVGTVQAGDPCIITGIVKDARKSARQGKSNRYVSIIKANHVITDGEMSYEILEPHQMDEIMQLSTCDDLESRLLNSIAPHIYGHDNIKRAFNLQLFSGTTYTAENGNHVRGDSHILVMGDPGVAKSELCEAVTNIAPRSSYASGRGASGPGLTASVTRDALEGDQFVLKAGALPMADGGICVIDEFDKVSDGDKETIHGAMEQQSLKINKAGIHASLRSRCGVLACANPKYGRFDEVTPIQEQVDVPAPLLSRFDLIYIMRDIPDAQTDADVAEHMLDSRRISGLIECGEGLDDDEPGVVSPPVPHDVFTRYIAYAKNNINPVLTKEAQAKILTFFKSMRGASSVSGKVHISFRYLFGLARLAEASAKMHLRNKATAEDAQVAIEVMADALKTFTGDDGGLPSMDAVEIVGPSQADKMNAIYDAFSILGQANVDQVADHTGMKVQQVSKLIGRMATAGDIMRVSGDMYKATL